MLMLSFHHEIQFTLSVDGQCEIASYSPGQVAQLVKAPCQYAKVQGSIPGQGAYKKQPMNA